MSGAAQHWDEALAAGRLLLQRPVGGGPAVFPPREFAPGSGAALEWFEPSGRGTVYSVTWIQRRPPEAPHNVVLVDLAEGARLMGRVEGVGAEALHIGMAVQARIVPGSATEPPLLVFDPLPEDAC
ncbi:OB-fold domain-containing protein [Novosphingobium sp.]|uniref:Zn-ribbon domain-containing OB-fold protein n=1 Tax=Novosphingobium sp. TaxID=1874826 RepID=UPI0026355A50|nr:OB-fold domain-containing protein [Novosphingobium sp.]